MKQEEVSRWAMPGQYWAMLKPLGLLRMSTVAGADGGSGSANRWSPEGDEEEILFIFPLGPDMFRFLWNEWKTTYHSALSFVPGDVWIYTTQAREQRLFFVGPETTSKEVQLLADHPLHFTIPQEPQEAQGNSATIVIAVADHYTPEMHLFQPGARRKTPPAKSAWEHISRDE